ncbi:MAG: hypothetical protein LBP91_01975 [Coriobacteriales bacterium]|jgi:ABC-2 type transport system permease protein|nr:hypothetical protein [Coriobacteriales bacterium]
MSSLAAFWQYTRFILVRERIVGLIWIVALAGSAILFAAMYPGLFSSDAEMQAMAQTMNTPAMVALMGPVYGLDTLNTAIIMAQECLIWFAIAIIIMNIFFVNRYTRADEELGRLEMFRALPVGRLTGVAATMIGALVLNLVIALITVCGLIALNLPGTTVAGAFAYGLAIGAIGFFFAALTLLIAQLLSSSRGVLGVSFALFGLFYVIRAWGDMQNSDLSYASPLGLISRVFAFYENNFWLLAILLGATLVITAVAFVVYVKRDLGEGVIPARPGRKHASRFLQSPFGLAWRLTRNTVFAWAVAAFVMGAVYGSVVGQLDSFLNQNEMIKQIVEGFGENKSLLGSYIAMLFSILAAVGAIPVVNAAMRIYAEEKRGRIEQVYAAAVPRLSLFASFMVIALVQSLIFLTLTVLGIYAAGESTGQLVLADLFKDAFVYLPALFLTLGVAVLLIGLAPRLSLLVWVVPVYSFLYDYFGRLFNLPDWVRNTSPFGVVPQLSLEDFTVVPLVVLTAVGIVFCAVGLAAYRRRDLR